MGLILVKQCRVCDKTFSLYKSWVISNDQLTCEECAQNKIRKDEHHRQLERNRQKEELNVAQHRREVEVDQQRHQQELERKERQKMLELKERSQAEIEKESNARLELEKRRQDETERERQHNRELQMEEVKTKGKMAEAKAKEADSMARAAEAEAKSAKAKAEEKEVELRSMLWKKYLDPETKMQDKQLIKEEIKRLTISSNEDQNVKKVPQVKEIKAPKSKGDLVEVRGRRPWTTSRIPKDLV